MADIEERLSSHSQAFDKLLSLIPAKHYYGAADASTQWNRKKQTKEESQRAKKAKLDPDLVVSAADMRREQQQKKRASSGDPDC
ncbi:drs2 neo1 protein [Rhizina undulata]